MTATDLAELGLVPDAVVRAGIRRLLAGRLRENGRLVAGDPERYVDRFAAALAEGPLAVATDAANAQHYEVPAAFFRLVLGPRLKYSSCLFPTPSATLAEAEEAMLSLTCERAGLADGQRVLELGCGWGSLTLWIAQRMPGSEITAISNSAGQREFLEARARGLGLTNIRVVTADIREFDPAGRFDRIVSVEMFEHVRNYRELFRRVASWLADDGLAFAHVFCHREAPYLFEADGPNNWMGRHFFTGGTMPALGLFERFDEDLVVDRRWTVDGVHYARTCRAWLANLDRNRAAALEAIRRGRPRGEARRALRRWRMFFLACAELFAYRGGSEWLVAHYLMRKRR